MSKEDEVLRFLLPDLLGKPKWETTGEGNLVSFVEEDIPPNCVVFFISIEEWRELEKK